MSKVYLAPDAMPPLAVRHVRGAWTVWDARSLDVVRWVDGQVFPLSEAQARALALGDPVEQFPELGP